jgi:hypothetical protein
MEKIFKTLFLTTFLLFGCVKECHLRYEPEESNISIKPLNLNTEISVNVKELEGIKTEKTGSGCWFPELKKEIGEAVDKDLRKTFFPIADEAAPKISLSIEVLLEYQQQMNVGGTLLASIPMFLGTAIGLEKANNLPPEQFVVRYAYGFLGIAYGTLGSVFLSLVLPTQKGIAKTNIKCNIYGNNGELINKYRSKAEIKKSFGAIAARQFALGGSESAVNHSLKEALDSLKFIINEDKNEILSLAEEYQERSRIKKLELKDNIKQTD